MELLLNCSVLLMEGGFLANGFEAMLEEVTDANFQGLGPSLYKIVVLAIEINIRNGVSFGFGLGFPIGLEFGL